MGGGGGGGGGGKGRRNKQLTVFIHNTIKVHQVLYRSCFESSCIHSQITTNRLHQKKSMKM